LQLLKGKHVLDLGLDAVPKPHQSEAQFLIEAGSPTRCFIPYQSCLSPSPLAPATVYLEALVVITTDVAIFVLTR
jgi:hypothetical protein